MTEKSNDRSCPANGGKCEPREDSHWVALQQPIELSCFAEVQKSRVEPRINFVPVVTDFVTTGIFYL